MCLQLLLSKALSCHAQNFTIVSDIQAIYSTWSSFVSVVNHCLWLCALSSWRRLDSWGVETGEICVNIVARGGSFVLWYDCIMVSWYGCSLSKTLVGSCIAFFGLNCCLAGRSVACKAADISNALINTYSFPSAVAGMVRNMCIWMVFCGHNWFLARRFWHYSGWPQLPVGGAG